MRIAANDLKGPALAYAVAEAAGYFRSFGRGPRAFYPGDGGMVYVVGEGGERLLFVPWLNWYQSGPLLLAVGIRIEAKAAQFVATVPGGMARSYGSGPTKLLASLRCYVAHVSGEFVDVPDGIVGAEEDENNGGKEPVGATQP